jgi:ubiquinone/menaquinone biosynthesis C-methylase UbiE
VLDLQPEMLARARERLSRAGVENVSFITSDAAALPFADASFDVVFLVTVLGEVAERERAASEIARVTKAAGRLSVTEAVGDPDRLSSRALAELLGPVGFSPAASVGGRAGLTSTFVRGPER